MKYKYFTLFAIFISLLSFNCKDNPEIPTESASNKYPLKLNNEWNYEFKNFQQYYSSDGVDSTKEFKTSWGAKVISTNEHVDTFSNVIELQVFSSDFPEQNHINYYINNNEGLFNLYYPGIYITLPKVVSTSHVKNNIDLNSTNVQPAIRSNFDNNVDTLINPLQTVLKYPLQTGKSWYEYDGDDSTWSPKRNVDEKVTVQTEAGNFECFMITIKMGVDVTDYISLEYGLVKRIIKADSLDNSDGTKKQWIALTYTITLTNVKVN